MSAADATMQNAFTVDLEDWFCVRNLRDVISFDQWAAQEQRVVASTTRLLDLLDRHQVSATFFVLATSVIANFQTFDLIFVLTNGGPANATTVVSPKNTAAK